MARKLQSPTTGRGMHRPTSRPSKSGKADGLLRRAAPSLSPASPTIWRAARRFSRCWHSPASWSGKLPTCLYGREILQFVQYRDGDSMIWPLVLILCPSCRFIADRDTADLVRECFVGLYPLDETKDGQDAVQAAKSSPGKYVVKPQREGGGKQRATASQVQGEERYSSTVVVWENTDEIPWESTNSVTENRSVIGYNTYGDDIPPLLEKLSAEELKGYILMELIKAPGFKNVLLRNGELFASDVVSELGIYGIWVR
ncbi:Glutathione synthetase [Linderina macrospora]|uniref:Glutathione synthetase n=1 Tax=Linderina macrospora TaxID=4868 RepID=A0ACC1JGS1_9FUNG|nr:Glutathione synthetase [Linderina macrospora]